MSRSLLKAAFLVVFVPTFAQTVQAPQFTISTVAGNGVAGDSGDGGPEINARMDDPNGIAVDAAGNLYIAEYLGQRVRKVATNGIITTVAGTGVAGFSGDGGPATMAMLNGPSRVAVDTAGNLYISDPQNYRIRRVSPNGTITTFAGNGLPGSVCASQ
jgi:sugar lactone lactonase YvrE